MENKKNILNHKWVHHNEYLDLIKEGKIQDTLTISGIALFENYLKNK